MVKTEISGIAPFFIVKNVSAALSFYRDRLGFDITFQGPEPDDICFGIVERGRAMIMLKDVGVDPVPNYTRGIKQGIARWDAYLHVLDPDALAAEFVSRDVELSVPLTDTNDGCVDSSSRMLTATCCVSAALVHEGTRTHENQQNRFRQDPYCHRAICVIGKSRIKRAQAE